MIDFPFTIAPAQPRQRAEAFRLAFQHMPARERAGRVETALSLIEHGELHPDGLLVAQAKERLLGAMICMTAPGASALVWPPHTIPRLGARDEINDQLVRLACTWLRQRGAKLAQALLHPTEAALAAPLERNGFPHVTRLWYLRHALKASAQQTPAGEQLTYQPYLLDPETFHSTLLRSYEQSQDCPEVTGVRTIEEIMEGHRAQGVYRPERWWLARQGEQPVGVLILTETPDCNSWDVSYVGLVPSARGQGLGRELMLKALLETRSSGTHQLTLSVDQRNRPAWRLYQHLGFEAFEEREVFLAIWQPAAEQVPAH